MKDDGGVEVEVCVGSKGHDGGVVVVVVGGCSMLLYLLGSIARDTRFKMINLSLFLKI